MNAKFDVMSYLIGSYESVNWPDDLPLKTAKGFFKDNIFQNHGLV